MPARKVALVGSSGGGAATLGHMDPTALFAAVSAQLAQVGAGAELKTLLFVACIEPLDFAGASSPAELWTLDGDGRPSCALRGSLAEVNERARELDAALAPSIAGFDGLISISADAGEGGVNLCFLAVAGQTGVPVAGTGGTSLALAAGELRCRLVGNAGGSVATSPQTKAIGVAAALAGAWGERYRPTLQAAASLLSTLDASLPAFLATACARAALARLPHQCLAPAMRDFCASADNALRDDVLPPAVAAIAAAQASGLGELAVMAGAAVGALARPSPAAALLGAWAYGKAAPALLAACARLAVPATATSLATGGGLAVVMGLGARALVPAAAMASTRARGLLQAAPGSAWLFGGVAGMVASLGARRGWYHAGMLPLILLEMERGEMALLGALDWLALCMTGAGACAAQLVSGKKQDQSLARRGLCINLLFGDYVEACYPFLERDTALDLAVYAASGVSGAIAAVAGARSTAYIAAPLAACLGEAPRALLAGGAVAFLLPFSVGCLSNWLRAIRAPRSPHGKED